MIKKQTLVCPSDLVPTSHHIDLPYLMGYDMCAETTLKEKRDFLEEAASEGWIVVFQHDSEVPAGIIGRDKKGKFFLEKKIDLPSAL